MLYEIKRGDTTRMFSDNYFDLYVWETKHQITRFQLCYDKYGNQRAVTWTKDGEISHTKVDEDNEINQYKMSPILVADGVFDNEYIAERFKTQATGIEIRIASLVYNVLKNYPKETKLVK